LLKYQAARQKGTLIITGGDFGTGVKERFVALAARLVCCSFGAF
jgi:hypothetical protein